MASNFPNSIDSFTVKVDYVDDVLAEHINAVQDAIVATQTNIASGITGDITLVSGQLYTSLNPLIQGGNADAYHTHNFSETVAHSGLSDMPDLSGSNTDHDVRYNTKAEILVISGELRTDLNPLIQGANADAYHSHNATNITYDSVTVDYMLDATSNSGMVTACTVTDTGGLGISWSSFSLYDAITNSIITIQAGTATCTDNNINYLIWPGSGTVLTLSTTHAEDPQVPIAIIHCGGADIWELYAGEIINKRENTTLASLSAMFPSVVLEGLITSPDPDGSSALDIMISSGEFITQGFKHHIHTPMYSRTDNMYRWFHSSGAWTYDIATDVDPNQYDDGTNLVAVSSGKWTKSLFIVLDGNIHWIYPQQEHSNKAHAITASIPTPPPMLLRQTYSTQLVMQEGETSLPAAGTDRWIDARPMFTGNVRSTVQDHSALSNLSADDHTQYLLVNGTRAMTGAIKTTSDGFEKQDLDSAWMFRYANGIGIDNTGLYFDVSLGRMVLLYQNDTKAYISIAGEYYGSDIKGTTSIQGRTVIVNPDRAVGDDIIYSYGTEAAQDGQFKYMPTSRVYSMNRPLLLDTSPEIFLENRTNSGSVHSSLRSSDGNAILSGVNSVTLQSEVINQVIAGYTVTGTNLVSLVNGSSADALHTHAVTQNLASGALAAIGGVTFEPTGFVDRTGNSISLNSLSFFISGVSGAAYDYYYRGTKTTKTSDTVVIPNTAGLHYIYFSSAGTLSSSTTGWNIDAADAVPVATIYWDGTTGLVGDERHGIMMDAATHHYLHDTVGTRYGSGLTGTFDATSFTITAGEIYDEDITHSITQQTQCRVLYRVGSSNWTYTSKQNAYFKKSAGNILQFDSNGSLTEVSTSNYMAYWIFATSDPDCPIYSLMGQRQDTTLNNARNNNTYNSLSFLTLPFAEMKLLYRVIVQRSGTNVVYHETADYRNVTSLPANNFVATDHGALGGLSDNDHTQYELRYKTSTTYTDTENVLTTQTSETLVMDSALDKVFNLPSVDATNIGIWFTFVKIGAGKVTIQAADSDVIIDSSAGGTVYNGEAGETYATLTLELVSATKWVATAAFGSWTTA